MFDLSHPNHFFTIYKYINNLVFKRKNKDFEVKMKNRFFKSLALVSILLFAWNCSEEASAEASTQEPQQPGEIVFEQS